jgi:hypothetical protein
LPPSWRARPVPHVGRVRDIGVTPSQGESELAGPGRPGRLCRGSLIVGEQDGADVVPGAVLPVVAVVATPRLGDEEEFLLEG